MSSILDGFGDKNVNQKLAISFYNPFKMERALSIGETGASSAPFYKKFNFRNTITSRSAKPIIF